MSSLPTERNSDNVPLIGTQIPDRPECGAQDPLLQITGVTEGRDRARSHEYREAYVIDR